LKISAAILLRHLLPLFRGQISHIAKGQLGIFALAVFQASKKSAGAGNNHCRNKNWNNFFVHRFGVNF